MGEGETSPSLRRMAGEPNGLVGHFRWRSLDPGLHWPDRERASERRLDLNRRV